MLERMWRVGTLNHCWWSCELIQPFWRVVWNYAQRATKMCIPFDPAISLLGLYPKEIIKMGKCPTCIKVFIAALFVVAKNWKSRGCPSIGEWLNKLWHMNVMEYYCAIRMMNKKTSERPGKTYMIWCWVKGAEPGEFCTQQQNHRVWGIYLVDLVFHRNARI